MSVYLWSLTRTLILPTSEIGGYAIETNAEKSWAMIRALRAGTSSCGLYCSPTNMWGESLQREHCEPILHALALALATTTAGLISITTDGEVVVEPEVQPATIAPTGMTLKQQDPDQLVPSSTDTGESRSRAACPELESASPTPAGAPPATTSDYAGERSFRSAYDPQCVARWPECLPNEYHPSCCRFPKSCSCNIVPDPVEDVIPLDYGPDGPED